APHRMPHHRCSRRPTPRCPSKRQEQCNDTADSTGRLDPTYCWFQKVALGPLFPEQQSMESHRPIRDRVAAVEREIATFLRQRRYSVLGTHGRSLGFDATLFAGLRTLVAMEFPPRP